MQPACRIFMDSHIEAEVQFDMSELTNDKAGWQALIRLYSLLLEVDMRNNPELYQDSEES